MHSSHIVEIGGVFVGVALWRTSTACTFVATHADVGELHGQSGIDPADLQRRAGLLLRRASTRRPRIDTPS